MINVSRLDAALDVTPELLAKNQVLSTERAGRAQKQDDQPQDIRRYSDERSRQLQHAAIMPESVRVCRYRTSPCPRRELLRTTGIAGRDFEGVRKCECRPVGRPCGEDFAGRTDQYPTREITITSYRVVQQQRLSGLC
jgi:hypothetical protein